ncbi:MULTISPECIES: extracellular catalytic domain type 2 short-chain-length polyhydroxyalkanoate depolymerase [unclassified Streptomyces]|uniref:extracellular catalytic domain type 2 short-chain-length polyhydroxyalkanoate depolymerase n=1 Tax=unclassified Streptomyces TaxID=2593676 RepID=UPI002E2D006E|nr:PHB depolymerase family esterase [Streptomyces sp. NBC_00272]
MKLKPRFRWLRRTAVMLLLATAAAQVPTAAAARTAAPAPTPGELKPHSISAAYTAGVSSGGYMATQLHVAYSGTFAGSAVFAAGPYGCAQGDLYRAQYACMKTYQDLRLDTLERTTRDWSAQGLVDPVANLSGDPVYLFSGSGDATVERPVADALASYYGRFGARVRYDDTTDAGHAWISPLGPNPCTVTRSPYVNACGIDAERDLLGHLTGPVNDPAPAPTGTLVRFDQNGYVPGGSASAVSMDGSGFLYEPAACAGTTTPCRLLVALHGCKQGYSYQGFGTRFMDTAYLDEYADTNHLLVLYPQAAPTTTVDNPNGCWNWWGYLGDSAYARHGGKQIEAIMNMVRALGGAGGGGTEPPAPTTTLTLPSLDAQDGYVKAAPDGSGAAVGALETVSGLALGRGSDGKDNRTLLSFDTSRIPAGKEVVRAYLTVARAGGSGDPWASPAGNRLLLDLRTGCFGTSCTTEAADWSAPASVPAAAEVPAFSSGTRASTDLSRAALAALDRTGTTQLRLRFASPQPSTAYVFLATSPRPALTVEYR